MAAYKADEYIGMAIESILRCNYKNWELIIVDDNSPDRTFEIALQYEAKDSRIRVYKNQSNLGDYPNRNKVATYAQGKYLKYLDNDDVLYEYSIDYMVNALENEPEAALALSFSKIDDKLPYPIIVSSKETYCQEFLNKGYLSSGPSGAMIRNDIFKEMGGFSGKPFVGDHELWLKISRQYSVIKLQPSLIWYRIHPEQQTNYEHRDYNNINNRYQILVEALIQGRSFFTDDEFHFAQKKMKQNYARRILRIILKEGKIKSGFALIKSSNLSAMEILKGFKGYIWD